VSSVPTKSNPASRLTWPDLVTVALIAAVSMVLKPYLRAPFSFVQTTLGVPIGVFLGGVYMFWPVLAGYLVPRRGVIFLTCLLQGLLALATGLTGLLGPMAFFSYLAPGVVIEVLGLLPGSPVGRKIDPGDRAGTARAAAGAAAPHQARAPGGLVWSVVAAGLGNVAGAATNALLFFALRGTAFTLALTASFLTGAAGGWLAHVVGWRVARAFRRERRETTREDMREGEV